MAPAFNSAAFFRETFFEPVTVTSGSETGTGILIDGMDPRKAGELAGRPGHWGTLYLPLDEFAKPAPQQEYTVDGAVWRTDSASKQGDVWEILVLQTQRLAPR